MRKSWVALGVVASFTMMYARPSEAQNRVSVLAQVLTPARVVRLHFDDGRTATGSVLRVTDSTVAVGACARCSYTIYHISDVAGVDTMIGHPVHAPRVAAGAFLGGLTAVGAYAAVASHGDRKCHEACGLWVLGVPPMFLAGAMVGGVIGAFHPHIHWDAVAIPPAST